MFTAKEFPYLFTILIALTGWTVNHITDSILSSKVLEYRLIYSSETYQGHFEYNKEQFQVMTCRLTNLTVDHLFKEVHLKVELKSACDSDEIYLKDVITHEPLFFSEKYQDTVKGKSTHFMIEALHPKNIVDLKVYYRGKSKPEIFFEVNKNSGRNISQPILFMKAGYETWILKNENPIFIALLVLWIVLIGFYFYKM